MMLNCRVEWFWDLTCKMLRIFEGTGEILF
jgi:hypothetical protein